MAVYIKAADANRVLHDMVQAQIAAFDGQQRAMETLNAETRAYVDKTRDDVNKSLLDSKANAEAYVVQKFGALKAQTETHVGHLESKVEEMRSLLLQHARTQDETADKNKLLVEKLEISQQRSRIRSSELRQKCSGRSK